MTQVADAYIRLRVDEKDMEKAVSGASGKAGKAADQGGKTVGSRFGGAMSKAAIGAGAAGGALFVGAIESATAFEDQLRTINTVAQVSEDELKGIGDGIQEVSRATGKTTEDLASGYYDLVSAGVDAADAQEVLAVSARLSVGALGTTGEAVDAVTTALNAYGMDASEAGHVTDVLASAVRDGKVTIAEIGSSLANVAPIAASAGISLEEVSAGYAMLTSKGVKASTATTQMRAAISALISPNEQLAKVQAKTGINFAKLAKQKGLHVALERLRQEYAKNGDALAILGGVKGVDGFTTKLKELGPELGLAKSDIEKLTAVAGKDGAAFAYQELTKMVGESDSGFAKSLGSVEALNFALIATGDGYEDYGDQVTAATESTGVATAQFEEKSKSATEQGKRLVATVSTFAQDIGGPFVGSLGSGIFALNELGKSLGIPIPAAKALGGVVGGLGAKMVTMGGKLSGKLAGGISGNLVGKLLPKLAGVLVGLVPMLAGAVTTLASGIGALFTAAIALWPVLLVAAIAAVIIALAVNPELRQSVIDFITGALEWIQEVLGKLPEIFWNAFVAVLDLLQEIIPMLGDIVLQLVKLWIHWVVLWPVRVFEVFQKVWGIVVDFVGQAGPKIVAFVADLVRQFLSIPGKVVAFVGKLIGLWVRVVKTVIPKIVAFAGKVVAKVLSIPGKIIPKLVAGFADMARKAVQAFMDGIANLPNMVGDALGGIGDFVGGLIPSFAVGTMYAPEGLAYLHEGEIVVPANESAAIREGTAQLGQSGGSGGGGATVNVYNPTPEPASTSTARELRKLSYMGVAG